MSIIEVEEHSITTMADDIIRYMYIYLDIVSSRMLTITCKRFSQCHPLQQLQRPFSYYTATLGYLNILQQSNDRIPDTAATYAALNGHLTTFIWLVENVTWNRTECLIAAIFNGYEVIVKYILDNIPLSLSRYDDNNVRLTDLKNSRLPTNVIETMKEVTIEERLPLDHYLPHLAARCGHWNIAQLLSGYMKKDNNQVSDDNNHMIQLLKMLARGGHLSLLLDQQDQLLSEDNTFTIDICMEQAALGRQYDVLTYLFTLSSKCPILLIPYSIKSGCMGTAKLCLVRYQQLGLDMDVGNSLEYAIKSNCIEMFDWVYNNYPILRSDVKGISIMELMVRHPCVLPPLLEHVTNLLNTSTSTMFDLSYSSVQWKDMANNIVRGGPIQSLQWLLSDDGRVELLNINALHIIAIEVGGPELVELLESRCPERINTANNRQQVFNNPHRDQRMIKWLRKMGVRDGRKSMMIGVSVAMLLICQCFFWIIRWTPDIFHWWSFIVAISNLLMVQQSTGIVDVIDRMTTFILHTVLIITDVSRLVYIIWFLINVMAKNSAILQIVCYWILIGSIHLYH